MDFSQALLRLRRGAVMARAVWSGARLVYVPETDDGYPRIDLIDPDGRATPWIALRVEILADDWVETKR